PIPTPTFPTHSPTTTPTRSPTPSSTNTPSPTRTRTLTSTRVPGTSTPTPVCQPSWHAITSPNVGTDANLLTSIAFVSSNDIWAVGRFGNWPNEQALTEHWNGSSWSVVPNPRPNTSGAYQLRSVS